MHKREIGVLRGLGTRLAPYSLSMGLVTMYDWYPPIQTGLDFKSSHFDPILGLASGSTKLRGLEI